MNDDDLDFKPNQSTSSNLTSLFDANKPHSSGNVSLTYTAPKAPKDGEGLQQQRHSTSKSVSNEKLKIITAKTVQVYKLLNEKYVNQGTAGVSIVGSYDLHMYQIILYRNNKDHICKILISTNFTFAILENNYASFYDSSGQNWSILFPSLASAQEFAKQVAIAKFNSQKNPEKIIVQDLLPAGANKNEAKKEDVIKLKCFSFMLNKEEIVPLKEKSCTFIELADCATLPWHEGLKNCTEQCQRVIIMPNKLSAPWTGDIPPTAAVLLELEIESITTIPSTSTEFEKVKLHKGGKAENIQEEMQAYSSSGDEDNCKEKMTSLHERVLLSKLRKMDLITRIAKMGHALPLKGALVTESCDSEEQIHSTTKPPKKSRTANNAVEFNTAAKPTSEDGCLCSPHRKDPSQNVTENRMVTTALQKSGVDVEGQQIYATVPGPSKEKEETVQPLDSRNIDLGLRLSIDKISEKVDHVLKKLEHLEFHTKEKIKNIPEPVTHTADVATVQGIVSENETLKNEVKVLKTKLNEQKLKIQSLMDLTQSCIDRCSSTEKEFNYEKGNVTDSEENAISSDTFMKQAISQLNQLISYIDNYRKEIIENHNKIKGSNSKVLELTEKLKNKEEELLFMEEELNGVRKDIKSLIILNESRSRDNIDSRSEDFDEVTENSKKLLKIASVEASDDYLYGEIKKVLSVFYKKLLSNFENDKKYSGSDVKDKIARMIKGVFLGYKYYKTRIRNKSREDSESVTAERSTESREMPSESYSAEAANSDRYTIFDVLPRVSSSRIKFAGNQETEISEIDENMEFLKRHCSEREVQHAENAVDLLKKFEIPYEKNSEILHKTTNSQNQRAIFEHEVEPEESVGQVNKIGRESKFLDKKTIRSVSGFVNSSASLERTDSAVESKADHITERHSDNTNFSVSSSAPSEIQNIVSSSETSHNLREMSSKIEKNEQNTSDNISEVPTFHSRDQFPISHTNENSMNATQSGTRQVIENIVSETTLDKPPLEIRSTTYQGLKFESILKNKEAREGTISREDNDFRKNRTSTHHEDLALNGKNGLSTSRLGRNRSDNNEELDIISDNGNILTKIQNLDLERDETEKSIKNLSNEPSFEFSDSTVQNRSPKTCRESMEEKSSYNKESVKEEEKEQERRQNDSEKKSISDGSSDSIKAAGIDTKETDDDNGSRINDEEIIEISENSKISKSGKGKIDSNSNERIENGPVDISERENTVPLGQMSASGSPKLDDSNGKIKDYGTGMNSKGGNKDEKNSGGSMRGNMDNDSFIRKISYIIKEGEIEPSAIKNSSGEGFTKNYFRSATKVSLEDNFAGYYVTEDENRMTLNEEEKANEGSMKEEDGEIEEKEKYNRNYKESSMPPKKIVTFSPNSVTDSSHITDYYKNWAMSIPPPLPLDGDDSSSQDDEEWL